MPYEPFLAGQKVTASALNLALLTGVCVFRAYLTAGQSVPTRAAEAVGDALAWDTIDLDRFGGWSSASPTRYTVPLTGYWTPAGSVSYNNATTGTIREAIWFVNGSLATAGRAVPVASGSISAVALTAEARGTPLLLNAGEYIQLVPLQNSSGALNTATGSARPYMSMTYSGPAA